MIENKVLVLGGGQQSKSSVRSLQNSVDLTVIAMNARNGLLRDDKNQDGIEKYDYVDIVIIDNLDDPETEIDLCRRLRKLYAGPILLLTSEQSESHQLRAYEAGVDECIVKPISDEVLMAKVHRWLLQMRLSSRSETDCSSNRCRR